MNISIGIADTDRVYLERLVEVLQEYEDLSVSIFTDVKFLERTLQNKKIDVLLFNPDISDEKLAFPNTKLAICLYSDDMKNAILYSDYVKIIKYQRISNLYKEIIKEYANKAGYIPNFEKVQNTKMIAVYSPVGGAGKTTISLAIASKFALSEKKVLFLSMEQLDSSSCLNRHKDEMDGITLLVESLEENSNFGLKMKGIIQKGFNGVFYIEGFERIVDYNSISPDEIRKVLENILRYGEYDFVVVDMESCLNQNGKEILSQADNVIIVEKGGEIPKKKLEMFVQQAVTREYRNKICSVINFTENIESGLGFSCIGKVPNYGNQTLGNMIQMILTKSEIDLTVIMK